MIRQRRGVVQLGGRSVQAWLDTGGVEVVLPAGRFEGPVVISRSVRIRGAGARRTVIEAAPRSRVLEIARGVRVELADVTLAGGHPPMGRGGAFEVLEGEVVCTQCDFLQHRAVFGGAVHVGGEASLFMQACRLAMNGAGKGGGAVAVTGQGRLSLRDVQLEDNRAADGGHHLYVMGQPGGTPDVVLHRVTWSPCGGRGTGIANVRDFEGRFTLVDTEWPADSLKVPQR